MKWKKMHYINEKYLEFINEQTFKFDVTKQKRKKNKIEKCVRMDD